MTSQRSPGEVSVRVFQPFEWQTYRDLRLRALGDSPDAFGGTLARAQKNSDPHWRSRLTDAAPETDLPLLARVAQSPGGMAWGRIEPDHRSDAHVYQMWVAAECRGLGVGRKLLNAVIDWAQKRGTKRVVLGVTCGDSPARSLYASAGFKPIGEPERLRPGSRLLAQSMELEIA